MLLLLLLFLHCGCSESNSCRQLVERLRVDDDCCGASGCGSGSSNCEPFVATRLLHVRRVVELLGGCGGRIDRRCCLWWLWLVLLVGVGVGVGGQLPPQRYLRARVRNGRRLTPTRRRHRAVLLLLLLLLLLFTVVHSG